MIDYLYSDDLSVEILARENAIEVDTLTAEIATDLSFFNESVFMESGENQSVIKKISDKISKVIDTIISFIKGIFTSLKLGVGDELKAEDYYNSEDVKIHFSAKAAEIQKELEEEILEGHKIVNAISKKSGVDPRLIDNLSQKAQSFIMSEGGKMLGIAATTVIANKLSKTILGGKELLEKTNEVNRKIAKEQEIQEERKERKLRESGHSGLAQLNRVTSIISKNVRKATSIFNSTVSELDKYKKK